MTRFSSFFAVVVLVASFSAVASAGELVPVVQDPEAAQDQQAMLYELNAARWDPAGWGEQHGIDLSGFLPQPPRAVNPNLTASAAFRAFEMEEFGVDWGDPDDPNDHGDPHRGLLTGEMPNWVARQFGYALPSSWDDDANDIESFAFSAEPLIAFLSRDDTPHRDHLLTWSSHLEVGVGRSESKNIWVVHTGYRDEVGVFVTGTVFDDLNGNGAMDSGEGLPGITVTAGGLDTPTNGGGGYSIEVPAGKHTITAAGPGFEGTSTTTVWVGDYNIGADFVSGVSKPVVRDYLLCKGREPTILGTNGNDIIYGTDGPDVIHGLAGSDKIYGLRGNDFLCGGGGNDLLIGGGGQDRLLGGWGNDTLKGNWGYDRLYGGMGTDTLNGGKGIDTCRTGETLIGCP